MRNVSTVILTGVLLAAGVLIPAAVAGGVEPVNVTVVRWPYT